MRISWTTWDWSNQSFFLYFFLKIYPNPQMNSNTALDMTTIWTLRALHLENQCDQYYYVIDWRPMWSGKNKKGKKKWLRRRHYQRNRVILRKRRLSNIRQFMIHQLSRVQHSIAGRFFAQKRATGHSNRPDEITEAANSNFFLLGCSLHAGVRSSFIYL